ncbi:DNA polymerase-3 subunit delta' [Elusimicrobium posterum]|uniref:DNA polymerase III subunit delta' n=1 Tax=Elusimicrobium posterum TaxID=3116653 RepID=UPI003C79554D
MFEQILGQEKAILQLKKFIASGRVPPALLFHGVPGIGKATAAKYFAMALNCTDTSARENNDACGYCQNCKNILQNTHPDFIFADFAYQAQLTGKEVEKQQRIGVDTIRSITAKSQQKSVLGKYKVLVVDRAETMQSEAANALLKYIEEPPQNTIWVLISSKKDALLATIKSRSQALPFAPLKEEVVLEILKSNGAVITPNMQKAARYSGGSISKAAGAAALLDNIMSAGADNPNFPYEVASSLSKTLAEGRAEAQTILDMVAFGIHSLWSSEKDDGVKEELKDKIEKVTYFKRAVNRNVSPQMVVETALMEVSDLKIF